MVELKSFSELSKSTSVEIQTYTSSPRFYNNGKFKHNFINRLSDQLIARYLGSSQNDHCSDGMPSRREEGEPMEENFQNSTWVRVLGLLLILSISIWCFFVNFILGLFIILSCFIWFLVVHFISGSGFLDPINFWFRDHFTANGQSVNESQQTVN